VTSRAAREVIKSRRAWRAALLAEARAFADAIDERLGLREVIVIGSVARGDFHTGSDVDVLVIAEHLPQRGADRLGAVGWTGHGRVAPVVWTAAERASHRRRRNPIAVEADTIGVVVWPHGGG